MNEYFSYYSNLDENKLKRILDELSENNNVLDFNRIDTTLTSSTIRRLADALNGKKVKMVNLNEYIFNQLCDCNNSLIPDNNESIQYSLYTKEYNFVNNAAKFKEFKYLYSNLKELCGASIQKTHNLIPSNVWTDQHFDLKKLFIDMQTVRIAVYLIALKVNKIIENKSNTKLITSSLNGGILASIIGMIVGIEHVSIPHLGPGIVVEDNRYMDLINKGDQLVYIYDFIAIGNEQKMVSVLAHLMNAKIIASIGITYHSPTINEAENTIGLIPFNEIADMHIAGSKTDLRILSPMENNNGREI
jgi:hypothetical protein